MPNNLEVIKLNKGACKDNNKIVNCIENLHKFHLTKQVDSIIEMFDENCEYYETPFEKIKGITNIKKEWQEILKQDIKSLTYKTLLVQSNYAIVNFNLKLEKIEYDIVYELKFNDEKCVYLKQWFMEK